MGKPFTIQIEDEKKIETLKKQLGLKTKIDVLRSALKLLEAEVGRQQKIKRWKKAARTVGDSSLEVLNDFISPTRFKNIP